MSYGTVLRLANLSKMLRKRRAVIESMKCFKDAKARARIGWNISHAQILSCLCSLAAFGHVRRESYLACTQKEQSPLQACPRLPRFRASRFGRFVREPVSAFPSGFRVHLCQFIKDQQTVTVLRGHAL